MKVNLNGCPFPHSISWHPPKALVFVTMSCNHLKFRKKVVLLLSPLAGFHTRQASGQLLLVFLSY